MIKSKGSKKKARRWSFAITTDTKGFHIPVVCFGTVAKANQIVKRIKEDYSQVDSLKGMDFNVTLIPHETISLSTQQQFDGLELEGRILAKTIELMMDDMCNPHVLQSDIQQPTEVKRQRIGEYVVKAKASLMKEEFPEGATVIEDSIERELTALESDDYKIPLGIDAYKEVLNAPSEDQ